MLILPDLSQLPFCCNDHASTSSTEASWKTQPKAFIAHLESRLSLWFDGDLESLLEEGRLAQKKLNSSYKFPTSGSLVRRFTNFMKVGNVKAALRLLEDNSCSGTLSLNSLINGHSVKRYCP
jgi:hypothetical protein